MWKPHSVNNVLPMYVEYLCPQSLQGNHPCTQLYLKKKNLSTSMLLLELCNNSSLMVADISPINLYQTRNSKKNYVCTCPLNKPVNSDLNFLLKLLTVTLLPHSGHTHTRHISVLCVYSMCVSPHKPLSD